MAQRKEKWWWIEHEVIRSVWIRSSGVERGKDVEKEQATELREREREKDKKQNGSREGYTEEHEYTRVYALLDWIYASVDKLRHPGLNCLTIRQTFKMALKWTKHAKQHAFLWRILSAIADDSIGGKIRQYSTGINLFIKRK